MCVTLLSMHVELLQVESYDTLLQGHVEPYNNDAKPAVQVNV